MKLWYKIGISLSGSIAPPQLPDILFPLINSCGDNLIFSPSGGWEANNNLPLFLFTKEKPSSIVETLPADSIQYSAPSGNISSTT